MPERVFLASNNADLGGGERMMLRHAEAVRRLGHPVTVVAPDSPTEVLDAAVDLELDVTPIRADDRRSYLRHLRSWDRTMRDGLLWCHGLIPALATAGRPRRIVHLHQLPRTRAQSVAAWLARRGALTTLVPSGDMARRLPGSRAHPNWTDDLPRLVVDASGHGPVGYLGRLSTDKGVDVLARAMLRVPDVHLLLAGDTRHVAGEAVTTVDRAIADLGARAERLGHVPPVVIFGRVRLMAYPSVWAEPFGLVVAEAMAAGVPFVVSDAGALPEVVGPDHPWVARAGDERDLARVIGKVLAASPDQVRGVTDLARERWAVEYSPASGVRRVRELFDDLGVR